MPNQVRAPAVRTNAHAFGTSFAAIGDALVYTVPANKAAEVKAYGVRGQAVSTVVEAMMRTGGNNFQVRVPAAGTDYVQDSAAVCLDAGEAFVLLVTTPTAADVGDVYISIHEEA